MYRAMCKCGGHIDFKRSNILNTHKCNKCGKVLVTTNDGNIFPVFDAKIKGYFKVKDIKGNNSECMSKL